MDLRFPFWGYMFIQLARTNLLRSCNLMNFRKSCLMFPVHYKLLKVFRLYILGPSLKGNNSHLKIFKTCLG